MSDVHLASGILVFVITVLLFGVKYFRSPKQAAFPLWGWTGLAIIFIGEFLLVRRVQWVATYFTPLAWTGYILLLDAMVASLKGQSRLKRAPLEFISLAFWSFPLWLIFEAYNLRLKNWDYVGLIENPIALAVGYVWAFSTIWPAIFETADLVQAVAFFQEQGKRGLKLTSRTHFSIFVVGLLFVTVPLFVPARAAPYMFGAVWMGFIFLLDPLNYLWKGYSLLREWETGRTGTTCSFLVAGLVCGIFWEFWNYWAGSKWLYVFPIWQWSKIFEMPLPGYLGFPTFALECLVMFEFLRNAKNQLLRLWRRPEWAVAPPGS